MYKTEALALAYTLAKDNDPFRIDMERYSILNWLGSVKGKHILDLACGGGNYSRLLCELGARTVDGVDCSEEMLTVAVNDTPKIMPITYHHCKAEDYQSDSQFDMVFHSYLLNCADSLDTLRGMCDSLFCNLNREGRMLGIIAMLGQYPSGTITYDDFSTDFKGSLSEGASFKIYFSGQDEHIINYNWSRSTYHTALLKAGFSELRWFLPDSNRSSRLTHAQWCNLEDYPVFFGVTGVKP